MDLFSLKGVKNLLKRHGISPSKRFGQNFLIEKAVFFKIIKAASLNPKDTVLEIGPGIGNLTQELAKRAKRVIAVEKDKKMIEILKETARNLKNVKIIQADILKARENQLPSSNYKIVANLPYYIVSPVIRKFLEADPPTGGPPKEMVLMVQKEIAQRICAKPPDMSLLAVSVQFYAKPEIVSFVLKKSFWPSPKVDSAIIKISDIKSQKSKIDKNLFFKIVKAGFSQPRKQLANNLSRMLRLDKETIRSWLLKNNIQPNQRAETLSIDDWEKLAKSFK